MILLAFFYQFILSEEKRLNLAKYVKGLWNSTFDYMTEDGEFLNDTNFFTITFEKMKQNVFKGTLKGQDNEFDVRILLNSENQQEFTIEFENHDSNEPRNITTAVMNYYKRNMPVARGQWENETQYFQIIIFSPINFELLIYRLDLKIIELFKFTKTPVPDIQDILKAIMVPVAVGLVFIAYNMYKVHEYIKEQEEKEAREKNAGKNDKNISTEEKNKKD